MIDIRPENLYRNLNGSIFPSIHTEIAIERATKREVTVENFLISCWKVTKKSTKLNDNLMNFLLHNPDYAAFDFREHS